MIVDLLILIKHIILTQNKDLFMLENRLFTSIFVYQCFKN